MYQLEWHVIDSMRIMQYNLQLLHQFQEVIEVIAEFQKKAKNEVNEANQHHLFQELIDKTHKDICHQLRREEKRRKWGKRRLPCTITHSNLTKWFFIWFIEQFSWSWKGIQSLMLISWISFIFKKHLDWIWMNLQWTQILSILWSQQFQSFCYSFDVVIWRENKGSKTFPWILTKNTNTWKTLWNSFYSWTLIAPLTTSTTTTTSKQTSRQTRKEESYRFVQINQTNIELKIRDNSLIQFFLFLSGIIQQTSV